MLVAVEGDRAVLGEASLPLSRDTIAAAGSDEILVGFRPESLDIVEPGTPGAFPVQVNLVEELGSDAFLYGELRGSTELPSHLGSGEDSSQIVIRVDPRRVPAKGDVVYVRIRAGEQHTFSAATGLRLP